MTPTKQLLISLRIPPDAPDRERAVRDAKAAFLKAICWLPWFDDVYAQVQPIGSETIFPALVFEGPADLVEIFGERVRKELPQLVAAVEDGTARAVGEVR